MNAATAHSAANPRSTDCYQPDGRVHLGSTTTPFRLQEPWQAVLPVTSQSLLTLEQITQPDLSAWWAKVEAAWESGRVTTETKPFAERLDFHRQLSAQLPLDAPLRVVYTKSGNNLCAAIVRDPNAIIDHSLYWARVPSIGEAHYLTGLLNSQTLLEQVARYQAVGLFGARHFDKYVFRAGVPRYDNESSDHVQLADVARRCEAHAATVDLSGASTFQTARKAVRTELAAAGLDTELEQAAAKVLASNGADDE